ncbi:hypothetical protein M758_UG246100 [Ceratodon purpureus]|nr:hypothetical protein M758_UG246100 [Ceratodon purpureus]
MMVSLEWYEKEFVRKEHAISMLKEEIEDHEERLEVSDVQLKEAIEQMKLYAQVKWLQREKENLIKDDLRILSRKSSLLLMRAPSLCMAFSTLSNNKGLIKNADFPS